MAPSTVKEVCTPWDDIISGDLTMDTYAANLGQVIQKKAPSVYQTPQEFFQHTYPTEGLKATVNEVFSRLSGDKPGSPIIKLETSLGGGKTHTLIALYHLSKGGSTVAGGKVVAPQLIFDPVNVAALVGTDLDLNPSEGKPQTLWGEIAHQLFGDRGYQLVSKADQQRASPGERVLEKMFGDKQCLILIDEAAIYLARASAIKVGKSDLAEQTISFLQELTQVTSSLPNVCLVITSLSKDTVFRDRTQEIEKVLEAGVKESKAKDRLQDAEQVLSRMVQNLTPTKGEEFGSVVRHRLFKEIDRAQALKTCKAYHSGMCSDGVKDYLPNYATEMEYLETIRTCYPFHPELIQILRTKTSSITTFNRTRGVLRLLSLLVKHIWTNDIDAQLIHPHHIDFANSDFIDELASRLDRGEYIAAIQADIADKKASPRAGIVDAEFSEPMGTWITTTAFLHSLTGVVGADIRPGANEGEIQLALYRPGTDPKKVENALKRLEDTCFYFDRAGSTYTYRSEPNLNRIIENAKKAVELTKVQFELEERIQKVFGSHHFFQPKFFPTEPSHVPDDTNKPKLAVMHFNDCTTHGKVKAPSLVEKIFEKMGTQGKPRIFANNVVFLLTDKDELEKMNIKAIEYLAINALCDDLAKGAPGLMNINESQQNTLKEKRKTSELWLKVAIVIAYRHPFVPVNQASLEDVSSRYPLRHLNIRATDTEVVNRIRSGEKEESHLIKFLRDNDAARTGDDKPLAPDFILDSLWPRKTHVMAGDDFKKLFYKNPASDILFTDELIQKTMGNGVQEGKWISVFNERYYDRTNYHSFPGGLIAEMNLILANTEEAKTAWLEFHCPKCKQRREVCSCGDESETCPVCQKQKDSCTCPNTGPQLPLPPSEFKLEDKTMSRVATDLILQMEEKGLSHITKVTIIAKDRQGLLRLANASPQFIGALWSFELEAVIDRLHVPGNFMKLNYKGDQTGFNSLKSIFSSYDPRQEFSSSNLRTDLKFDTPVPLDSFRDTIAQKVANFTQESTYTVILIPAEKQDEEAQP